MGKNKKQISLDSEKLIVKERSEVPDQFHSSELPDQFHSSKPQAFEILRRRGVALAFADILSWECHERYLQQLTSHLRQDSLQTIYAHFFFSGMADHALRLGPYVRISCYQENCNMDTGGRMRTGKS